MCTNDWLIMSCNERRLQPSCDVMGLFQRKLIMFTTVKTCVCLNDNFDRNTDDFPHCNADDERFLLLGWHAHKTYLVPAFLPCDATLARYMLSSGVCPSVHLSIVHYRAFNAIFGKVGRFASKEVIVELLKMKCLPVLFYGIQSCPLSKSQIKSLDFAIDSAFS